MISRSPSIALVGSRRASADGLEVARELGRTLSLCGVSVVSGMALGIDSAAHEGALAADGRTIAVLACGPERAYPARRKQLHAELARRSVVVSELPPARAVPLGISGSQPNHRGLCADGRRRRSRRALRLPDHG